MELDVIDWERVNALREEVGAEDFDEVVELFLEEVDAEISSLESAASQGELGAKLHFLKGSALSLGFSHFSKLCQSGEALAASNPESGIDLPEIFECYQTSRKTFLDNLSTKTTG
jgi:HPt (histidine-containing phosphotransfer) domain-containing protein